LKKQRIDSFAELSYLFGDKPLFIFAYGSLMWNLGFPARSSEVFTIEGYVRDFCILSTLYRGTKEAPGLVLGLRESKQLCVGKIFEISNSHKKKALQEIWDREMILDVYIPTIFLAGEKSILCFVANPQSESFCLLKSHQKREIIHKACGTRGSCLEYFENTRDELARLGIQDPKIEELL
jgi:cation transport protein ChaC